MKIKVVTWACALGMLGTLGACGGGGSGSSVPGSSLSGTVATGVALAGATVTLKDAQGNERTATSGSDGRYTLNVTGLSGPFVLRADGSGKTLFSIALTDDKDGVINITPLSSLVAGNAGGRDPAHLFSSFDTSAAQTITDSALNNAIARVRDMLAPVYDALGVPVSVDGILRGAFVADHSGIDKVLDTIQVIITGSTASILDIAGNTLATDDLADPDDQPLVASANATSAAIAGLFADLSRDCGTPHKTQSASLSSLCMRHFASTAAGYLHEGFTDPHVQVDRLWLEIHDIESTDLSQIDRTSGDRQEFELLDHLDEVEGEFKVRYKWTIFSGDRVVPFRREAWVYQDQADGKRWKFKGNQQRLWADISMDSTQFQAYFSVNAPGNWPSEVASVKVLGPGIPAAGLILDGSANGPDGYGYTWMGNCLRLGADGGSCGHSEVFTVGGLEGTHQQYTFTAYSAANAELPAYSGTNWLWIRDEPDN